MAIDNISFQYDDVFLTSFQDINEDIFREIFSYLKDEFVYFSLRVVNKKLKLFVDAYIQLDGIFLTNGGRDSVTEVMYVLKRNDHVRTIVPKIVESYPYPPPFDHQEKISSLCCVTQTKTVMIKSLSDLGSFSAMINGAIVIGTHSYCMEIKYAPRNYGTKINGKQYEESRWKSLQKKKVKATWPFDIRRYDVNEGQWIPIRCVGASSNLDYLTGSGKPIKFWCLIGDSNILTFHDEINLTYTRLLQINIVDTNKSSIQNSINMAMNFQSKPHTFSSRLVNFPFQLVGISQFSVVRTSRNKVMLVGGVRIHNLTKPNLSLWEGTLTEDGTDVIWEKMKVCMKKPVLKPVCFMINSNLYITGGEGYTDGNRVALMQCDRFSLIDKTYSENVFDLPHYLNYDYTSVVTGDEETLAMLLDERTRTILFFTEARGFEEYKDFYPSEMKPNISNRILLSTK